MELKKTLDKCDEHRLSLYEDGDVLRCKLGCVIHKNRPDLRTIKKSIKKFQDKIMITQNPDNLYYQGMVDALSAVLKLMEGNPDEIQ